MDTITLVIIAILLIVALVYLCYKHVYKTDSYCTITKDNK